jgi:hypothetical protein
MTICHVLHQSGGWRLTRQHGKRAVFDQSRILRNTAAVGPRAPRHRDVVVRMMGLHPRTLSTTGRGMVRLTARTEALRHVDETRFPGPTAVSNHPSTTTTSQQPETQFTSKQYDINVDGVMMQAWLRRRFFFFFVNFLRLFGPF